MIDAGDRPVRRRVRRGDSRSRVDVGTLAIGYCARRVPMVALGATFAASATAVWVGSARLGTTVDLIPVVRVASVLFAAAAATCLEDPNAEVLDTAPFGRLRLRSLTVGMTASATIVLWSIVVLGAAIVTRHATDGGLPIGGLAIELIAICMFGWLAAAALLRGAGSRGTGTRAAAVVVVGSLFTLGHPRSIEWLWAGPGPTWRATREHWALVGTTAAIVLFALSRDPAGRTRTRSRPSDRTASW